MKPLFFILYSLPILLVASLLGAESALAGGAANWTAILTPSRSSAPADNTTLVTVAIHATTYLCTPANPDAPESYSTPQQCSSHGYSGSTLSPAAYETIYLSDTGVGYLSTQQINTDANGNASITAHSGTAGTQTITAYYSADYTAASHGSTSISYTAIPTPAPAKSTPKPTAAVIAASTPKPSSTPTPVTSSSPSPSPIASPIKAATSHDSSQTKVDPVLLGLSQRIWYILLIILAVIAVLFIALKRRKTTENTSFSQNIMPPIETTTVKNVPQADLSDPKTDPIDPTKTA